MVIVGWCLDVPMTLEYTIFESCSLMFSLIMINLLLAGGKSDYFKGVLLVAVYLIVAILAWFAPAG
jgi:Ca2+:H+ antiporter